MYPPILILVVIRINPVCFLIRLRHNLWEFQVPVALNDGVYEAVVKSSEILEILETKLPLTIGYQSVSVNRMEPASDTGSPIAITYE